MEKKPSILDNPLLADYHRSVRRFLGLRQSSGGQAVALLFIVGALYLFLLLLVLQFAAYMETRILVNIQNLVFCFSIPAVMHGLIAAEREKRSWDVLATTPLTNKEIIWGKFFAGLLTQWITVALMALPMLIVTIASRESKFTNTIVEELISIAFAFCLAAICIAISSYSKRAYTAQLLCYTALVTWLVVLPVFINLIAGSFRSDWLMLGHPFTLTHMVSEKRFDYTSYSTAVERVGVDETVVIATIIIFLAITAAVLHIIPKKLMASESETPRRDSHA